MQTEEKKAEIEKLREALKKIEQMSESGDALITVINMKSIATDALKQVNEDQSLSINPVIIEAYTNLWYFFFDEHNLILLNEQMDEIIRAVDQFKEDCKKENNQ